MDFVALRKKKGGDISPAKLGSRQLTPTSRERVARRVVLPQPDARRRPDGLRERTKEACGAINHAASPLSLRLKKSLGVTAPPVAR